MAEKKTKQSIEKELSKTLKAIEKCHSEIDKAVHSDRMESAEAAQLKLQSLVARRDVHQKKLQQLADEEAKDQLKAKEVRQTELSKQIDHLQAALDHNEEARGIVHEMETRLTDRNRELWTSWTQESEDNLTTYLDDCNRRMKMLVTPPLDLEGTACIDALMHKLINERQDLTSELAGPPQPSQLKLEYAQRDRDLRDHGQVDERQYKRIQQAQLPPQKQADEYALNVTEWTSEVTLP